MISFGDVLESALAAFGPLCVGIDPNPQLLLDWGLPDSADGAREMALKVVEAAGGAVGIVKPQVAFFERFGSAGYQVLEEVIQAARAAGLTVIADAKRGDIGSTLDAYAQAWLTPGSPLEADALTVHPYHGPAGLTATMRYAVENGKGLFVLAATSNPEGRALQAAVISSTEATVARSVLDAVVAFNSGPDSARALGSASLVGSVGVVIGATVNPADYGIDVTAPPSPAFPVLAPGFGAQGGKLAGLSENYGGLAPFTVVVESRSILSAGPYSIAAALAERAAEVRAARG